MHPVIFAAVSAIQREHDSPDFPDSLEAVGALLCEFGEKDLADFLFASIPSTVPFQVVASLFDFLAWQTSDNGGAMTRTAEQWLREGDDERKLLIALHLQVYPFIDGAEMEQVLTHLAAIRPSVAERCLALIAARNGNARLPNDLWHKRSDKPLPEPLLASRRWWARWL